MGVVIQEPAGTATGAAHTHRRQGLVAFGLLTVVSVGLSVLGIGTGNGPLGPPGGYEVGISREVGAEFTEGGTVLRNDGWFTAHLESIRPLPVDGAAAGMPVIAVDVAPPRNPGIGMVDGSGFETLPQGVRSRPEDHRIPPRRTAGERASDAEVLVRAKIEQPGTWTYRGYEVTYRSGWVRHSMVVDIELVGCTPSGAACSQPDG